MPHELHEAGSPGEWLRYANSDLELAQTPIRPKVLLEGLCFHAHQAAEKALKAILISLSVQFPKTHNIRILLDKLAQHISVPEEIDKASILTDYAVISRYPGEIEPVQREEYLEAVRLAEKVVSYAENVIKRWMEMKAICGNHVKNDFTAVIEPAEEGGFFAYCPEVPEANGQGETREQCLNNLREAIALVLEDRRN